MTLTNDLNTVDWAEIARDIVKADLTEDELVRHIQGWLELAHDVGRTEDKKRALLEKHVTSKTAQQTPKAEPEPEIGDWTAKARAALDLVNAADDEAGRLRVLERALRWAASQHRPANPEPSGQLNTCGRCGGTGQAPAIRGNRIVIGETMPCPACDARAQQALDRANAEPEQDFRAMWREERMRANRFEAALAELSMAEPPRTETPERDAAGRTSVDIMARWIVDHRKYLNGARDHACAGCYPGGDLVSKTFKCGYHLALAHLGLDEKGETWR